MTRQEWLQYSSWYRQILNISNVFANVSGMEWDVSSGTKGTRHRKGVLNHVTTILAIITFLIFIVAFPVIWQRLPISVARLILVLFGLGFIFVAFIILKNLWWILPLGLGVAGLAWAIDYFIAKKNHTEPKLLSPLRYLANPKKPEKKNDDTKPALKNTPTRQPPDPYEKL